MVRAVTALQKAAQIYRQIAIHFLSTALLGALAVGAYALYLHFGSTEQTDDPIKRYGIEQLMPGYPGRTREDIAVLMKETYDRPLIYEPYTHFRELPSTGRFVNITEAGYRLIEEQGPWPIEKTNLNVFVFGGSTTFGAGVADSETIPSALQRELRKTSTRPVCVYNFGRGFHYSSQERILFSNLLVAGHVPDAVIFIDGLNDHYRLNDAPQFSSQFMGLINQSLHERKGVHADVSDIARKQANPERGTREEKAARIIHRYLRNKTIITGMARAHGIRPMFVWQPVPVYKFDLNFHPFARSPNFIEHQFSALGYQYLAELRRTNAPAAEVLWLADMQEKSREQLYVDAVHYTAKMCSQIAAEVARAMREQAVLP
jgi:hypothetical protein